MKRGARLYVLEQNDPRNKDADYIELEIPFAAVGPLIAQLGDFQRFAAANPGTLGRKKHGKEAGWVLRLLVEASHPKATKDGKIVFLPSLLKDSIPREGGS